MSQLELVPVLDLGCLRGLRAQGRCFGKRKQEQKVLGIALLPHRTVLRAIQTSQPTNVAHPRAVPSWNCLCWAVCEEMEIWSQRSVQEQV